MAQYDVIFLGYPIWWGAAPRIISTFLEAYDLSGKTIVPFCTSGSSGIGSSVSSIRSLASGASVLDGRRFNAGARADVNAWVDTWIRENGVIN
jgi:flavodoxin